MRGPIRFEISREQKLSGWAGVFCTKFWLCIIICDLVISIQNYVLSCIMSIPVMCHGYSSHASWVFQPYVTSIPAMCHVHSSHVSRVFKSCVTSIPVMSNEYPSHVVIKSIVVMYHDNLSHVVNKSILVMSDLRRIQWKQFHSRHSWRRCSTENGRRSIDADPFPPRPTAIR